MSIDEHATRLSDGIDLQGLVEQEEMLRILLDLAADSIVRFDPELRYDYVNDETVRLMGRPRGEWLGRTQTELGYTAGEVATREARLRTVFVSGEPATYVDQIDNLDGSRWYEAQLFPQRGAGGEVAHVVVISRDITERMEAEQVLRRQARIDPLTGLANRTALVEELERAMDVNRGTGSRAAALLIDIDHFKFVNDSLGHTVGDLFLKSAAERITSCVRPEDLVARHGGDEYVIVLHDVREPSEATAVAERILETMRRPFEVGGVEIAATASIGVALTATHPAMSHPNDLVREADTAMFVAKGAGRDGIAVYDDVLHRRVQERFTIANGLRRALERNELAVWYQPEVDLATGQMRAVEALLRWHHPSGTIHTAGQFIEVAAETGLIVEIGYWALDEICASAARWKDRDLVVRVNLAPRQLAETDLLPRLDSAMSRHGVRPEALCAEITETAMLQDSSVVHDNLAGLSERGVMIAIDDFGTGYASLSYLRRYAIDLIKIDRSFITDIGTNEADCDLTAAVIALAQQLRMDVTAEGIEEPTQAAILRSLGCRYGQGFLYSRAVPAERVDAMLGTPLTEGE